MIFQRLDPVLMPVKAGIFIVLAGGLLGACGGDRPIAPVSEQGVSLRQPESATRTVVHGDTLYSIAWESGRDYHELAAWNGLAPPYTIVVGQPLRLYPPPAGASPVPEKKTRTTPRASTWTSRGAAKSTTRRTPATVPASRPPAKAATRSSRPASQRVSSGTAARNGASAWVWPATGKVLKNFNQNGSGKGLDIGGSKGQPIQAAAAGRVVYQGSGLRGYGQLIIVKHSGEYLSAYAHNDRIYVKEGDSVKRGQKIAAMGDSGTDHVKLHFEIRRNGKPVDPLKYLPKR